LLVEASVRHGSSFQAPGDGPTSLPRSPYWCVVECCGAVQSCGIKFRPFWTTSSGGGLHTRGAGGGLAPVPQRAVMPARRGCLYPSPAPREHAVPAPATPPQLGSNWGGCADLLDHHGRPWPDRDHAIVPPPLAVLDRGRSYLFTLKNASPFLHPIHIHGHTFKVVRSTGNACRCSGGYRASPAGAGDRGCLCRRQSRRLDAALSRHRTSRERNDGLFPGGLNRTIALYRALGAAAAAPRMTAPT
jgi:Multicopper oxidase